MHCRIVWRRGEEAGTLIHNAHLSMVEGCAINSQAQPCGPLCVQRADRPWAEMRVLKARAMYRTVPQAAGFPLGWPEGDNSGHQCWPGSSRGGGEKEEGTKPTNQHLQSSGHLTSMSTSNLVFIIPTLQMRKPGFGEGLWLALGSVAVKYECGNATSDLVYTDSVLSPPPFLSFFLSFCFSSVVFAK